MRVESISTSPRDGSAFKAVLVEGAVVNVRFDTETLRWFGEDRWYDDDGDGAPDGSCRTWGPDDFEGWLPNAGRSGGAPPLPAPAEGADHRDAFCRGGALFSTIVADPPWEPSLGATWATRFTDKARPQKQYDVLSLDALKAFSVPAAPQSHLYLWVLNQHVDWGYELARAWGFEPWQVLTWAKPGLGTGRFQCNTEHVLVCRKGTRHGNPFGPSGGTWFNWPRGRHSEKPAAFFDLVERMSPPPYLEMFARTTRLGWSSFGNEVPSPGQRGDGE